MGNPFRYPPTRCLIPGFNGASLSSKSRDALWASVSSLKNPFEKLHIDLSVRGRSGFSGSQHKQMDGQDRLYLKVISVERVGNLEPQEAEIEAARSSLATGLVSPAGVYPALASRFDFWPVATPEGQGAAIGLAFDPDERPSAPATLVDIVGRFLALALDRQHFRVNRDARP
jgi:hypothetical protein